MIHELRTYTIQPPKFKDFVALTAKVGIKLRTKHSKVVGYWTTEIGELNQVVHIWEYEDFDHRTRVRAALAKDKAWNTQFLSKSRPMIQHQESMILVPVDFWPFTPPASPGIYELRSYRLYPGKVAEFLEHFQGGLQARLKYSKPVGIWSSELGELNRVVHLWQYESLEQRGRVRKKVLADPVWKETVGRLSPFMQVMEAKILVPTEFSPLK
ncbi:MAG: NIPSNAP family protein [Candidatus Rokubacteria bacterium]|nr:NIPSNAP family protein [Candidatus Rokubacteria bacterium]